MCSKTLASQNFVQTISTTDNIQKVFKDFLLTKRAEGVGDNTLKLYKFILTKFAQWLATKHITNFSEVEAEQYRQYFAERLTKVKPRSVHVEFRALRTLSYWYETEHEDEYVSPFHKKVKAPKLPKDTQSVCDEDSFERLLEAAKKTRNPLRNVAMLLVAATSGLRASELANLKLEDMNLHNGLLRIRQGKGKKDRVCVISREALKATKKYLSKRNVKSEYLFCMDDGNKLSYYGLRDILTRLEAISGLRVHGWHSFRRMFATTYLARGGDVISLSALLGHASVSTTALYVKLSEEELVAKHRTVIG